MPGAARLGGMSRVAVGVGNGDCVLRLLILPRCPVHDPPQSITERGSMPTLRAVIYLRAVDDHACLRRCKRHCARHGYRIVGVVVDPGGERWGDVAIAGFAGEYEVLVFCPQDLIPGRVPRMEPADEEEPPDEPETRGRRRPGPA